MNGSHHGEIDVTFRLFEAPLAQAADPVSARQCVLCGDEATCLGLTIGHDIIRNCSACNSPTAMSAVGDENRCVACAEPVRLAESLKGRPACFKCLASGRFAITKDSSLGMIRWEDAIQGRTHGLPLPPLADGSPAREVHGFATLEPNDDGWQSILVPRDALLELTYTPDFLSIQGSVWEVHCRQPMTFVGRWGRSDFNDAAPDGDGRTYGQRIGSISLEAWEALGDRGGDESDPVWTYAFRCLVCGSHAASWDFG